MDGSATQAESADVASPIVTAEGSPPAYPRACPPGVSWGKKKLGRAASPRASSSRPYTETLPFVTVPLGTTTIM